MVEKTDQAYVTGNEDLRSAVGKKLVQGESQFLPNGTVNDVPPEVAREIRGILDTLNGNNNVLSSIQNAPEAYRVVQELTAKLQGMADGGGNVGAYVTNLLGTGALNAKNVQQYNENAFNSLQTSVARSTAAIGQDPSVIDKVIARNEAGYEELDPRNNPILAPYAQTANAYATGAAQAGMGSTAATAAGQAIAGAGMDSRTGTMQDIEALRRNAGISARDVGIVRDSAMGRGPSAAQILGQQMLQGAVRGMGSVAATARGGNLASAMRGALAGGQATMLQGNQQLAALRAQEQLNAQQLMLQGNANVGQQYGQAGTLGGQLNQNDITRATYSANALNNTYGINASTGVAGMQNMGAAADAYASGMNSKVGAQQAGDQGVMNVLSGVLGTTTGASASNYSTNSAARTAEAQLREQKRQYDAGRIDKYAGMGLNAVSSGITPWITPAK